MPFAEINGTTLCYQVKGSGLPILFIHPPLLAGNNFQAQLDQLSDTYQIITVDMRGHGKSPYSEQALTIPLLAQDVGEFIKAHELSQAYICGYSTGGSVALAAMLAYPELFRGGILLSAMSEVSDAMLKSRFWAAICASGLHAKRMLTAAIAWGNSESRETFKRLYSRALEGDTRNHKQYYQSGLDYNCTRRLKEIRMPALLLYGEQDSGFYKYAKILNRHLPGSALHFIPKAKHQLPTKWAAATNRLIRQWVEDHRIGPASHVHEELSVPIPALQSVTAQEAPLFQQE